MGFGIGWDNDIMISKHCIVISEKASHDDHCMYDDVNICDDPVLSVYHAEKQLFVLNFRGLSFEFHIESKFEVSRVLKTAWLALVTLCCQFAPLVG